MKKTLLLATLVVATALSAFGQGVVSFNNRDAANNITAPVFDIDGVTKLDGASAQNFKAALYGAAGAGQAESSLVMLANPADGSTVVGFRTGAAAGLVNVGSSNGRVIPGAAYGSQVTVQIRAWAGAATDYATALATGAKTGKSNLITMGTTTGPTDPNIPAMVGLQSFSLVVPEPSSIALGLLGLGALTLFRRRK